MSDGKINVDPKEREEFAKKLIDFEQDMKDAVAQLKNRLETASGYLQDPGSVFYISEANNLVEELEKLLDGGITGIGIQQRAKAQQQMQLMSDFAGGMKG